MRLEDAGPRRRVLLALGDARDRRAAEHALRDVLGPVVVVHAGSASEIVAALAGPRPDAVVVELLPAWRTGTDLAARIAARWPEVPVISIVGPAEREDAPDAAPGGTGNGRSVSGGAVECVLREPAWEVRVAYLVSRAVDHGAGSDGEAPGAGAIAHLPVAVHRAAPDGSLVDVNSAWLRLMGYSDALPVLGTAVAELFVVPGAGQQFLEALSEAEEVRDFEAELRRGDGETLWARLSARQSLRSGGESATHDCVIVDGTAARRTLEDLRSAEGRLRAAQRGELLCRIASGVAHDFNNLLTTVRGCAELALQGLGEGAVSRRYVEEIVAAADEGAVLSAQLLAFGREHVPRRRPVDIAEVVDRVRGLLRSAVRADVELEIELASEPGTIVVDSERVTQAVLILVTQARDALRLGGRVSLSSGRTEAGEETVRRCPGLEPGPCVTLTLRAAGPPGTDSATLRRALDPAGLAGPSAVGEIVRESRGGIETTSHADGGVSVTIHFPRVPGLAERGPWSAGDTEDVAPDPRRTVLVAEDDDRLRFVTRRILEDAGYDVLEARGVEEASAVLAEEGRRPALVVTDVLLSDGSGADIAARIEKDGAPVRVLYVSGHEERTLVARGVLAADAPFLAKPFSAAGLLRRVKELLPAAAGDASGG